MARLANCRTAVTWQIWRALLFCPQSILASISRVCFSYYRPIRYRLLPLLISDTLENSGAGRWGISRAGPGRFHFCAPDVWGYFFVFGARPIFYDSRPYSNISGMGFLACARAVPMLLRFRIRPFKIPLYISAIGATRLSHR